MLGNKNCQKGHENFAGRTHFSLLGGGRTHWRVRISSLVRRSEWGGGCGWVYQWGEGFNLCWLWSCVKSQKKYQALFPKGSIPEAQEITPKGAKPGLCPPRSLCGIPPLEMAFSHSLTQISSFVETSPAPQEYKGIPQFRSIPLFCS